METKALGLSKNYILNKIQINKTKVKKSYLTKLTVILSWISLILPFQVHAMGCDDPLNSLSDNFNDAASISNWTQDADLSSVFDMTSNPGFFTMESMSSNDVWYNGDTGPFLYKNIVGNFIIETQVEVYGGTPGNIPSADFKAGGIGIYNETTSTPGSEDWIMYNIGFNSGAISTERKDTVNSASNLALRTGGSLSGKLRVCRVGNEVRLYRCLNGDGDCTDSANWSEEVTANSDINPDAIFGPITPIVRSDFMPADSIRVGILSSSFSGPTDLGARFNYVRFFTPDDVSDCLENLNLASVGDKIYEDENGNGTQDPSEEGISDVTLDLYCDTNNNQNLDNGDVEIEQQTTDNTGNYVFEDLIPGDYLIDVSDEQNVLGNSQLTSGVSPLFIQLLGGEQSLDAIFGYQTEDSQTQNNISIGGWVWEDLNSNGIQDVGEPGFPNIRVNLLDSQGALLKSTTSLEDGLYVFVDNAQGDYILEFPEIPIGYILTAPHQGSPETDSEPDPEMGRTEILTISEDSLSLDAGLIEDPIRLEGSGTIGGCSLAATAATNPFAIYLGLNLLVILIFRLRK